MKPYDASSRGKAARHVRTLAGQATAKAIKTVTQAAARARASTTAKAAQVSRHLGATRLPGVSQLVGAPPPGPHLTGTPFARTLATALTARPHLRRPGSTLLGSDQQLLNPGIRLRRRLKHEGYTPTPPDGHLQDLDPNELGYVHGGVLMHLQRWPRRAGRRLSISSTSPASLAWVQVSRTQADGGAMPWLRLCVDTGSSPRLLEVLPERHLDIVVAPLGQEPAEYAADLSLLLPDGLPAQVSAALRADPARRTGRLHLLDGDRVAVDLDGRETQVLTGVPHAGIASLVVTDGRVRHAEVWLGQRRNWIPGLDLGDLLGG